MTNYLDLPVGPEPPVLVHTIVEIPRGSVNKYEYDKTLHVFKLDRTLYTAMHYPGDYGFIPRTHAGDNDPLDIIILTDTPSFTGCLQVARPIGALVMRDQEAPDEKVIAVAQHNPRYKDIWTLSHIAKHVLLEIQHFFTTYKDLEGKHTEAADWLEREATHALILECADRYAEMHAGDKQ